MAMSRLFSDHRATDRGPDALRGHRRGFSDHNASVPADAQADACACAACRDDLPPGDAEAGPAVAAARPLPAVTGAGARHRGPVQDESGALDPLDAQAMREVEGRSADCDSEDHAHV